MSTNMCFLSQERLEGKTLVTVKLSTDKLHSPPTQLQVIVTDEEAQIKKRLH